MPKLIYVMGLRGITPQVIRDDSVFGVMGEKNLNILQEHTLNENEEEFSLDLLTSIYPYMGET